METQEDDVILDDLVLHFDKNGKLKYNSKLYTPNELCKKIYNKPTNAWTTLKINDKYIDFYRLKYRDSVAKDQ
ncbi:hypothetical protein GE118_02875 [Mycoplasma sp. NEAQ87857]|uniref:hypothetical protein n=1 Tax=Mycoplasma sp. NEAQ87857 TaxID=2683967 RepID=UPI001315EA62|nr:hypothetical protein [Mycoplasma sp. NEAQ87857]QGZ97733.1 hypothetical protein GE118_02875 [Mycoplasma sp. NEAQ87857]